MFKTVGTCYYDLYYGVISSYGASPQINLHEDSQELKSLESNEMIFCELSDSKLLIKNYRHSMILNMARLKTH